jgi:hypothetical protein
MFQAMTAPHTRAAQAAKVGRKSPRPDAAMGSAVVDGVNYRGLESMGYSWMIISFLRPPSAASDARLMVSIPLTQ